MRQIFYACSVLFLLANASSFAETSLPILKRLVEASDQIYHVIAAEERGVSIGRTGILEYSYESQIKQRYKGKNSVGTKIYFHFSARDIAPKSVDQPKVKKGSQLEPQAVKWFKQARKFKARRDTWETYFDPHGC